MASGSLPPDGLSMRLGGQERGVLAALLASEGRVMSRRELARQVGLADLSARRCDALLVGVRRAVGAESIRTVRGRGWMIEPAAAYIARQLLESSTPT